MDYQVSVSNRRGRQERRCFSWRTVLFGFCRSRRITARRTSDVEAVFLDWRHPWLFFLALGIMLLSCLDAFLTLQLLSLGMIEANPVMALAMEYGTKTFVASKSLMTGGAILILAFCSEVYVLRYLRTGIFLTAAFCLYSCLICYEFVYLLRLT